MSIKTAEGGGGGGGAPLRLLCSLVYSEPVL